MSIKLNIGCGGDLKPDYINIDMHEKQFISERYGTELNKTIPIYNYNIFDLPYESNSVDEILCFAMLEHLSFENEGKFLKEVKRILKKDGIFIFTVPDIEKTFRQWLEAKDEFKDFYRTGTDEHWFGQGDRNINTRWGYLTAVIFGNQNGEGQFHRNAYTVSKIQQILHILDFTEQEISFFEFKNTKTQMIRCKCSKN
jgi:predicted SAM-dependent methyltransferase